FPFSNFATDLADGGVCAGISRTTDFTFNGEGIEHELQFDPKHWRSKVSDLLNSGKYSDLSYDIRDQLNDYPFIDDGELFDYRFTDQKIAHLSDGRFKDTDTEINPSDISEPDHTLIKLLETQWMYSNEQKYTNQPDYPFEFNVIEQVEDYLSDGQIIYASL